MKPPETNARRRSQHHPGHPPLSRATVDGPHISPDTYTSPMIVSRKILHNVLSQPSASSHDILESRETCSLIVQAMTPAETLIAACRWLQLPDTVPAALLGISTHHVSCIMHRLKHRLITQYPCLRVTIEGRHRNRTSP